MEGLDKKGVAFGRIIEGLNDLQNLSKDYDPETFNIQIVNCGRYNFEMMERCPL